MANKGTQGGTHEQHVKAGEQSHKDSPGGSSQGGTHEQHECANRQIMPAAVGRPLGRGNGEAETRQTFDVVTRHCVTQRLTLHADQPRYLRPNHASSGIAIAARRRAIRPTSGQTPQRWGHRTICSKLHAKPARSGARTRFVTRSAR